MKNKGFTLVEMLVSLAIFSILLVAVLNTFVKGYYYQKRVAEMQAVEREGSYLMELISREIRMASDINNSQADLDGAYKLTFRDHDGSPIQYCFTDAHGNCSNAHSGENFSVRRDNGDWQQVNSSGVKVTNLSFFTSESFSDTQPLITISMRIQSVKEPSVSTVLQTSVAMRLYNKK